MRWSRAHAKGPLYHTSTAVVMSEVVKIVVSALLLFQECGSRREFCDTVSSPQLHCKIVFHLWLSQQIRSEILEKPDECLKLLVPGVLYTLQNNLQYVAAANLQPAVFQVTDLF
jgi:solute carrier family 35 (UDP-sugar transporter), member A1/2/3